MLSSVTLNCQATKIVMNSGSQLSELQLVSQMSQVSGIVIVFVFVFVFVILFLLVWSGQVSWVALGRCSLNVFVFVIVFVYVFVLVVVFLLVRSCPLITLIKCLKGHKSLGSLFEGVLKMYFSLSLSLSLYLSLSLSFC